MPPKKKSSKQKKKKQNIKINVDNDNDISLTHLNGNPQCLTYEDAREFMNIYDTGASDLVFGRMKSLKSFAKKYTKRGHSVRKACMKYSKACSKFGTKNEPSDEEIYELIANLTEEDVQNEMNPKKVSTRAQTKKQNIRDAQARAQAEQRRGVENEARLQRMQERIGTGNYDELMEFTKDWDEY